MQRFHTDYHYTDRETKARYVWLKYQLILKGRILDVGADKCHLERFLSEDTRYWGIGLGAFVDQEVDLEKENIPFPDDSFDCVLCLDVLEHLDNLHEVFDELCRVTQVYLIISLPNAWADHYSMLRLGEYAPNQPTKFYGLPLEPPPDRHKWFFSSGEAERFVLYRTGKNGLRVVQIDFENMGKERKSWRHLLRALGDLCTRELPIRRDVGWKDLHAGTLWAVLRKERSCERDA